MMKLIQIAGLSLLFLLLTCSFFMEPDETGLQSIPVSLGVPQLAAGEKSTYRVIISGEGVDAIGSLVFSDSQSVNVSLPQKNNLWIFCGKYDSCNTLTDSGSITVNVIKGMGLVEIQLTALPMREPSINMQPSDRTVTVGATGSFTIGSCGTQLTYQWQKATTDIPGATSATCFIPAAALADDSTRYRCIVRNPAGSDTSASAVLSVFPVGWIDTIPPVVTFPGGDTVRIRQGDPDKRLQIYIDQVNVVDNCSELITKMDVRSNVNVNKVNAYDVPYTILYRFADPSGNIAEATRYVHIYKADDVINRSLVITMWDSILYVQAGTIFTDPGVEVFDEFDRTIPLTSLIFEGKVDTDIPGEYLLTYTATDAMGNWATAARKVIVLPYPPDTIVPVIVLIGADTIVVPSNVAMADFIASYQDPGYKAYDLRDGDLFARVRISDFIQLTPAIWYKTYDVTDLAGNAAATIKRFFRSTSS